MKVEAETGWIEDKQVEDLKNVFIELLGLCQICFD